MTQMEEKEGAYFLEKKSRLNPLLILLNPSRYFFLLWSLDYNVQAFLFFYIGSGWDGSLHLVFSFRYRCISRTWMH